MTMPKRNIWMGLALMQAGVILGMLIQGAPGSGRALLPESAVHGQMIPDPAAEQRVTNELLRGIDGKLSKISSQLDAGIKVMPVAK